MPHTSPFKPATDGKRGVESVSGGVVVSEGGQWAVSEHRVLLHGGGRALNWIDRAPADYLSREPNLGLVCET